VLLEQLSSWKCSLIGCSWKAKWSSKFCSHLYRPPSKFVCRLCYHSLQTFSKQNFLRCTQSGLNWMTQPLKLLYHFHNRKCLAICMTSPLLVRWSYTVLLRWFHSKLGQSRVVGSGLRIQLEVSLGSWMVAHKRQPSHFHSLSKEQRRARGEATMCHRCKLWTNRFHK